MVGGKRGGRGGRPVHRVHRVHRVHYVPCFARAESPPHGLETGTQKVIGLSLFVARPCYRGALSHDGEALGWFAGDEVVDEADDDGDDAGEEFAGDEAGHERFEILVEFAAAEFGDQ